MRSGILLGIVWLLGGHLIAQNKSQRVFNKTPTEMKNNLVQQIMIDRFTVPANARAEFLEKMYLNRSFVETLPGFVEGTAYEQIGGEGEYNFVTVAAWESEEALANAKKSVSAYYQKQNINLPEMLNRLNVKLDRAVYQKMAI